MIVKLIQDASQKKDITRLLLESLQDWFGLADSREEYIAESQYNPYFCAYEDGKPIGFLYLKETGKDTVELAAMGVLQTHHRKGIGKALFQYAKSYCCEKGYSFLQVKTVQMGKYASYDQTNRFYQSLGFKEFEVFPTLWDAWNPCQIYAMALN